MTANGFLSPTSRYDARRLAEGTVEIEGCSYDGLRVVVAAFDPSADFTLGIVKMPKALRTRAA